MCFTTVTGLSKAETQALTNYGSGEDENEEEEENYEFEARPVDVQTSLEANAETTDENEKEQVGILNILQMLLLNSALCCVQYSNVWFYNFMFCRF